MRVNEIPISRERNKMTISLVIGYYFERTQNVLRGNAIGISRERNNISRERNIIARERNTISREHDNIP